MRRLTEISIPVLGRRGAALLLTGTLWLFVAWGVSLMPLPRPGTRPLAPHEYAPVQLRVAAWAVAGVVAIACAFLWKQIKGQDGLFYLDRLGFALLIIMPMERTISWLTVLAFYIPGISDPIPLPPFANALSGFAVWLVVCLHLFLINGWAEPVTAPEVADLGRT